VRRRIGASGFAAALQAFGAAFLRVNPENTELGIWNLELVIGAKLPGQIPVVVRFEGCQFVVLASAQCR
jgi:hypothetical protein